METKARLKPKQLQMENENLKEDNERLNAELSYANDRIELLLRENVILKNKLETIGKLL